MSSVQKRPANSDVKVDGRSSLYVATDDLEDGLEVLEEKGRLVLVGPPGCGKTTLAYALLRRCRDQGFTPYILTKVEQWNEHVVEGKKCVVLMDGVLGRVSVIGGQHQDWSCLLTNVLTVTRPASCRLILTAHPHVLRQLRALDVRTESPFVDDVSVVQVMRYSLTDDVKTSLLHFHLKDLQLDGDRKRAVVDRVLERDLSGAVFPWCCRQMCRRWKWTKDPTDIFTTPAEAYVPLLQQMMLNEDSGDLTAAVLLLTMMGLGQFLLKPLRAQVHLQRLGFSVFCDDRLEMCADLMKGFILAEDGGGFASRVLYDAVGLALGRSFRLPSLLKVCDRRFLVKYVRTKDTATEGSVSLGSERGVVELFVKRMYEEIVDGHLPEMSQHPCLQCPDVLDVLEDLCHEERTVLERLVSSDQPSLHRLLTVKDPEYQLPLLYWSCLGQSPVLTQWCLTLMRCEKVFLHCWPRVLLALALFLPQSHQDVCRQLLSSLQHSHLHVTTAFTFPTNTVLLPLPRPKQQLSKDLDELCRLLSEYQCGDRQLCYLATPSLPLPPTVVNLKMWEAGVRVQVTDRQHWYLLMRLLTDTHVDQVDEQGNTVLRLAFDGQQMEIVSMIVRNEIIRRYPHCAFVIELLFDFIEKISQNSFVKYCVYFFLRLFVYDRITKSLKKKEGIRHHHYTRKKLSSHRT